MSGQNTKASKIDRILRVLREVCDRQAVTIAMQMATIRMLGSTTQSLEAENARLRKYLGSVLFERRKRDAQIPTLCPCAQFVAETREAQEWYRRRKGESNGG